MKWLPRPLLCSLLLAFGFAHGPRTAHGVEPVRLGGVELIIEAAPELVSDGSGDRWRSWLESSLQAARTVTGDFPRSSVRIDLRAARDANDAIAFGQIRRGHPPRIRFWVSPDAGLEALRADWRGYHEFAHLLIPFPGNDDIWFTEGLASYYQYLLQSRSGLISEQQAWTKLLAGFDRGRRDPSGRGRTLRDLSPDMWRQRAFRRVYWTGAAFFLRVDTRLRRESDGAHSLDSALAAFHRCCIQDRRRWNAEQLVERLGQLSIASIWHEEYRRTIDAPAEPMIDAALRRLGIDEGADPARFTGGAPERRLREAIAARRDEMLQPSSTPAP